MYTEEEEKLPVPEEDNESDDSESYDSLNSNSCNICGRRLLNDEWEEFEDMCSDCAYDETSGIITDSPEKDLNLDE